MIIISVCLYDDDGSNDKTFTFYLFLCEFFCKKNEILWTECLIVCSLSFQLFLKSDLWMSQISKKNYSEHHVRVLGHDSG